MLRALGCVLIAAIGLAAGEFRLGRASVAVGPGAWVKVLVFDAGGSRAALVVVDGGDHDAASVAAARAAVEAAAGVPASHVMLCSTRSSGSRTPSAKIAEAGRAASASIAPVRIFTGSGREESAAFYSRFLMKDGGVRTNPRQGDPEIVQPMGEIDEEVRALRFDGADGATLATLLNFALCGTHGAAWSRTLGKIQGPGSVVVITAGACGNAVSADARGKSSPRPEETGEVLAGESIKVLARAKPAAAERLKAMRETVRAGPNLDAEVQVIALGPGIALVGLPGEPFAELGAAIKRASPFPVTVVAGLANGNIGIVPTRKAFEQGGDDVRKARIEPGAGERIAETALRLLPAARREVSGR